MKRYFYAVVHNCLAHPLIPLAMLCDGVHLFAISDRIYHFHDVTAKF